MVLVYTFRSISEVFILLFLCVSWLPVPHPSEELEILELFSGRARLCRLAKSLGMAAQAHDITYDKHKGQSSMDFNQSAGYMSLCIPLWSFFVFCFGSRLTKTSTSCSCALPLRQAGRLAGNMLLVLGVH